MSEIHVASRTTQMLSWCGWLTKSVDGEHLIPMLECILDQPLPSSYGCALLTPRVERGVLEASPQTGIGVGLRLELGTG